MIVCNEIEEEKRMRRAEKRRLMKRIEAYIKTKLLYMLQVEKWTGVEIAAEYKFPSARQTEIKNPDKYPHGGMNQKLLETLLKTGFVNLDELLANVAMSKSEREYTESLEIN